MDRTFNPMILLIEEGDRVWWSWEKNKVSGWSDLCRNQKPCVKYMLSPAWNKFVSNNAVYTILKDEALF